MDFRSRLLTSRTILIISLDLRYVHTSCVVEFTAQLGFERKNLFFGTRSEHAGRRSGVYHPGLAFSGDNGTGANRDALADYYTRQDDCICPDDCVLLNLN